MTEANIRDEPTANSPEVVLTPNVQTLLERSNRAEVPARIEVEDFIDQPIVVVSFPKGRGSLEQFYDEEGAEKLLKQDFESVRFLEQTEAMYCTGGTTVEVRVRVRTPFRMMRVPGVTTVTELVDGSSGRVKRVTGYRLRLKSRSHTLEISIQSPLYAAVTASSDDRRFGNYTVKATFPKRSFPTPSIDIEAIFRRVVMALFFELDVRYGMMVDFGPARQDNSRASTVKPVVDKVHFPKAAYPLQALSLYQYGRWANGLPLLAFLAFYQVLEFFFPVFSQAEAVLRVRQVISNPRFSLPRDMSVLEVVQAARESGGGFAGEREQLQAAIEHCTTETRMREFFEPLELAAYFTNKKQALPGVKPIRLTDEGTLLSQVAERVYNIRCRIVHTKSDGGDAGVELLLPDSSEARQLSPEVELLKALAQWALVAGGGPLDLN